MQNFKSLFTLILHYIQWVGNLFGLLGHFRGIMKAHLGQKNKVSKDGLF